jgi:hypothetical protein
VSLARLLVVRHRALILLIHRVAKLSLVKGHATARTTIVLEFPVPVQLSTTVWAIR